MSWKTETLIINWLRLKEEHDLESDDYNNLLILEKKAKELYQLGILTPIEVQILNLVSNGSMLSDINKEIPLAKKTISLIFKSACEKISFCLGGEFTDFGTIDELSDKYELTNEQIENLITYMKSEHKHKLSRIKK